MAVPRAVGHLLLNNDRISSDALIVPILSDAAVRRMSSQCRMNSSGLIQFREREFKAP